MKSYTVQLTAYHKAEVVVDGSSAIISLWRDDYVNEVPVPELVETLVAYKHELLSNLGSRMTSRKIRLVYQA